ncbi:hypothetical protein [Corynebacterium uterequi]|uniref:Uncharacterized protein n=1 Tax=Corynebacterium uterequi TaxID=1072256 RepID=A0A0G3HIL5_9CORY|nr:hypothetical protein [Corynebacterium uterequi]AKK11778.1 hypothetical protein CUTER_09005 [Corynebacterium uterequi]
MLEEYGDLVLYSLAALMIAAVGAPSWVLLVPGACVASAVVRRRIAVEVG